MTNMCKTPVITGKGHTCEEADYWLGKPWICGSWMMASCSPRMEQKRQFTFLWGTNEHMHFSTIVGYSTVALQLIVRVYYSQVCIK